MRKEKLPVLFVGHGSPMNAVLDNPFTRAIAKLGRELPRPKAVLCVSAHWLTDGGLLLNGAGDFETIHDFYSFPDELYKLTYAPPPAKEAAKRTAALLSAPAITGRGLDHGAWTVLRMLYPKADVPVYQLSVDYPAKGDIHYELGRRLAPLREEGVLILGSGNIAHNLGRMDPDMDAPPAPWNTAFDGLVKEYIDKGRRAELAGYENLPNGPAAVPTPDHYWPFLTALGAGGNDKASYPYEGFHHASLSMRAVLLG